VSFQLEGVPKAFSRGYVNGFLSETGPTNQPPKKEDVVTEFGCFVKRVGSKFTFAAVVLESRHPGP
jgi:hypothetical protein